MIGPREVITIVGSVDMILASLTLGGLTNFLIYDYPEVPYFWSDEVISQETFDLIWFLANITTGCLFWIASANMALAATLSSTEKYEGEAFIPWFVVSMFFLFMSLMGSALASDLVSTVAVVIWRTTFLCCTWIAYEKWGDEEDDDVEEQEEEEEDDDDIFEPVQVKVVDDKTEKK